jgi:predicted O-methyltransferase YrrM
VKFDQVAETVKGIPYTRPRPGKILYDFVCESGVQDVLELGFAHGVSTCYIAAALDERGAGSVITIDLEAARDSVPNILTLLERTGLGQYVTPVFTDSSYIWELMQLIEERTEDGVCRPRFDFCFIDGAHTWEVDGFAFFLVDKLLRPGGWVLFDDVYWTFAEDVKDQSVDVVQMVPVGQRVVSQVERVFSLLVCQHAGFENISIRDKWGWAQKKAEVTDGRPSHNVVKAVYAQQSVVNDLVSAFNKLRYRRKIERAKRRSARSLR